jgi:hypothetical protein
MNEQIKAARDAYQAAAEKLIEVTRHTYPVGMKINVRIAPHIVTVEVTGHSGAWWCDPGQISGVNVITGKPRSFSASQVLEVAP